MVASSAWTAVFYATVLALVVTWTTLAATTRCQNETPAFAAAYARAAPGVASLADAILDDLRTAAPRLIAADRSCAPATLPTLLAIASGLYVLGIAALERVGRVVRTAPLVVVGVTVVAQAFLFGMPALLSSDVLDYASYGRVVTIYGANPYAVPPSAFPGDPLASFGAWKDVVSVYGPLWTRVDASLAALVPSGDAVALVFAYKVLAVVLQALGLGLMWWLTGQWSALGILGADRTAAFALFAWNPLVVLELVGNAHNEVLMIVLVLAAIACLTLAVRSARDGWWMLSLVVLGLGALVKFVPGALAGLVAVAWLRRLPDTRQRLVRGTLVLVVIGCLAAVVAQPWLDSTAVLQPLRPVAAGGLRYKNGWQDAPAAWLEVRVLAPLDVSDVPVGARLDAARSIAWGVTRIAFIVYLVAEVIHLWRVSGRAAASVLRSIAAASTRMLVMGILLLLTQVHAWYWVWPLPFAALLGWRHPAGALALALGLVFQVSYYIGEFEPFGPFYRPLFIAVAASLVAAVWLGRWLPRRVGFSPS